MILIAGYNYRLFDRIDISSLNVYHYRIAYLIPTIRYIKNITCLERLGIMSTHSVKLDDEAEDALGDIIARTGLSISDAIKQGLIEYRKLALATTQRKPADFFKEFDLGEGGYSISPARDSKRALKDKLLNKRK
jgi:hypothetical protein